MNHKVSEEDILEMKVWILQFVCGVTSNRLFDDTVWYKPIKFVRINKEWYNFLFQKLGLDLPKLDIFVYDADAEERVGKIWGNFYQFNDILCKIENHIKEIGKKLKSSDMHEFNLNMQIDHKTYISFYCDFSVAMIILFSEVPSQKESA